MVDPVTLTLGVLDYMTPILVASVGEIIAERSGVVNIGIEGMMLFSAFAAAVAAYETGSPLLGLLAGVAAGLLLSLLHAVVSVYLNGDQIISGIGINFLAYGASVVGLYAVWGQPSASPPVPTLPSLVALGVSVASTSIAAIPIVIASWWMLEKTTLGLRLSACGEDPRSAEAMGVNVHRMRLLAVLIGGAMAGYAGAHLAVGVLGGFSKTITGPGRGFIALANVAFSNWNPLLAVLGAYVFGFFDTLSIALSEGLQQLALGYPVKTIPYLATIAVLAVVAKVRGTRMPRALGKPYIKE